MPDMHEQLDREARRVNAGEDALAIIRQRAARRRNHHRVASGVLGLAVAATGILLAVRAFDRTASDQRPAQPAPAESAMLPVWPAGSSQQIDRIQQEVDGGHQPWRRDDPLTVARVFADVELGWAIDEAEASVRADDPFTVVISNPSLSEAVGASADIRTTLLMERWRGREDGILVISSTTTDVLNLRTPQPGDLAPADGRIRYAGALSPVTKELDLSLSVAVQGSASTIATNHHDLPSDDGTFDVTGFVEGAPIEKLFFSIETSGGAQIAVTAFGLVPADELTQPSEEEPLPGPSPSRVAPTPQLDFPANYRLLYDSDYESHVAAQLISTTDLRVRPQANAIRIRIEPGEAELTRIFRPPHLDLEAGELREKVFPGAEIHPKIPGGDHDIRVELGLDFVDRYRDEIKAYEHIDDFMASRSVGSGAERFLSEDTLARYERGEERLSLYGYATEAEWSIAEIHSSERVELLVFIFKGDQAVTEVLTVDRVSDPGTEGGQGLAIIEAHRDPDRSDLSIEE